jgi:mono/diheme cytochrome c family protein
VIPKFAKALLMVVVTGIVIGCSDDDPPVKSGPVPTISITANPTATEGQTIPVTVSLEPPTGNSVSWTLSAEPLSATSDDYNFPVTVVFVGSDNSVFLLPIVNDTFPEGSELMQLKAGAFTGENVPAESLQVRIQPSDGGVDVGFVADVLPLFEDHCATCHIFGSGGGLNLGSPPTALTVRAAEGSSGTEVYPGRSAQSFLYMKTTGAPPTGNQMPPGGPFLSDTEQNIIRDWIDQGCQDN